MFNPNPRIQVLPITPRHACYVIDDALADPQLWVDLAQRHCDAFAEAPGNAFPGPEVYLSDDVVAQLVAFFNTHMRSRLHGRRTSTATARMSLVTRQPEELKPYQCICHVDARDLQPGELRAACVLYLFHNTDLGGTAFYTPARAEADIAELMDDANTLSAQQFSARHGIASGYMTQSNAWFEKVLSVPARWNRIIFYSGTVLHSGDIRRPDLLSAQPATGRLTINGFFTCTRALSA